MSKQRLFTHLSIALLALVTSFQLDAAATHSKSLEITHTVGGHLFKLATGKSVVLKLNGTPLTVNANGAFTFTPGVSEGTPYTVTSGAQPDGQSCRIVENGSGVMGTSNITNVVVRCVPAHTVGGTVSGLADGETVTLTNRMRNELIVSENGAFTFTQKVKEGLTYRVRVTAQPAGKTCTVTNRSGIMGSSDVTNVTVHCGTTFAYVSNYNVDTVAVVRCKVNSSNALVDCQNSGATGIASAYQLVMSPSGAHAYIADRDAGKVHSCEVNATTGALSNCVDAASVGGSSGITLNQQKTIVYISNQYNGRVNKCDINPDETLSNCVDSGAGAFGGQSGIALNNTNNTAYVVGSPITFTESVVVFKCPVALDGTFGSCVSAGNTGVPFSNPVGIILNKDNTRAYVTDYNNKTVLSCPINNDGSFGACADSGVGAIFTGGPFYLVMNTLEDTVYVTSEQTDTMFKCTADETTGSFSNCATTGSGFSNPIAVTLFTPTTG